MDDEPQLGDKKGLIQLGEMCIEGFEAQEKLKEKSTISAEQVKVLNDKIEFGKNAENLICSYNNLVKILF